MKFKRLIPALAMLLVSAILLGTSTFAWFSMNTTVTASNMVVKAVADQGILINEVNTANDGNWDNAANTTAGTAIYLHATSTADTKTWYSAHSKLQNSAAAAALGDDSDDLTDDGYKVLGTDITTAVQNNGATAGSVAAQAITYADANNSSSYNNGEGYYVMYTYYIKSSADEISLAPGATGQTFNIKSVSADLPTSATSADLDKSLRVAVVVANSTNTAKKAYIFAPVSGATSPYYVNASSTATTPLTGEQATCLDKIPATNANGVPVYVYIWFEGEDTNLKTSNALQALDEITVEIEFELKTNTTAATDNGVSAL